MKYDRFFSFGCSFTNWHWPTWADIIGHEFEEEKFFNLGISGAGNEFIFHRLTEANARYNLNHNDLVIISWTNFAREDRWIRCWQTPGNIFNQTYYDSDFRKKYFDLKGALIKTSSFIAGATHLLDSVGCDYIFISAFPMRQIDQFDNVFADKEFDVVFNVYKNYYKKIKISITEHAYGKNKFENPTPYSVRIKTSEIPGVMHDREFLYMCDSSHPTVLQHLSYVEKIILPEIKRELTLSEHTLNWINEYDKNIQEQGYFYDEQGYNRRPNWHKHHSNLL
jgi:hypothetical protein